MRDLRKSAEKSDPQASPTTQITPLFLPMMHEVTEAMRNSSFTHLRADGIMQHLICSAQ